MATGNGSLDAWVEIAAFANFFTQVSFPSGVITHTLKPVMIKIAGRSTGYACNSGGNCGWGRPNANSPCYRAIAAAPRG